jgi:FkbM family methyltransferase
LHRYANLIRNVSNWPTYFLNKLDRDRTRRILVRDRKNAIQFDVPRTLLGIFKEIYLSDIYAMAPLCTILPPCPKIVDVGANVGIFSLRLLALKPDATVFAYEPLPSNFDTLHGNADRNPQLHNSLRVFQCAVTGKSESEQKIFFNPDEPYTPTASLIQSFAASNRKSVQVPTVSLDTIVEEHALERIHLLKLDCEGSEFDILSGAAPEVLAKVDAIVMEVHESGDQTIERMQHDLDVLGFLSEARLISEGVSLVRAIRPEVSTLKAMTG